MQNNKFYTTTNKKGNKNINLGFYFMILKYNFEQLRVRASILKVYQPCHMQIMKFCNSKKEKTRDLQLKTSE